MNSLFLKCGGFASFVSAVLVASSAWATPNIQFDDDLVHGGSVDYAGGSSVLVGTDITVDSVLGFDTPANNNMSLTCSGCLLNFTTGAFQSVVANGAVDTYTFGAGGSIEITGTLMDGATVLGAGTLLSGSFDHDINVDVNDIQFFAGGSGENMLHSNLLAFYGLADLDYVFTYTQIGGVVSKNPDGSFNGNVNNLDLNSRGIADVPEPGTIAILGAGLLGFGLLRRRHMV